jgi:DNA-binding response OmpR family regulator
MTGRRTILIVEDDSDLRRMFRLALALEGFVVLEAADGLAALHIIDSERPDLVVLDLGLPVVSGHAVRAELAAHAYTRQIPVVVVTGWPVSQEQLEVACLLRKPVEPGDLITTVRRCLAASSGIAT